jgi:16S rRNA (cytidine1402-2'-O)-methyltransferase
MNTPGVLYIAATPLGNMGDVTVRLGSTLTQAALVLAEDTRVSGPLVRGMGYTGPLVSYREAQPPAAKERVHTQVISVLRDGGMVVFVSDAGTPGVSDPAGSLVAAVTTAGLPVSVLPGASALTALLSVSGLPLERPLFVGFLPKKKGRQTMLRQLELGIGGIFDSFVCFESPHRIIALLEVLATWSVPVTIVLGRELTKLHEEILRGSPTEVLAVLQSRSQVKGEVSMIVSSVLG